MKDAAALVKDLGYDGLDLTVRLGGHVEPAQVADAFPAAGAVRVLVRVLEEPC